MITELRLRNWKSFADATLYIDPLTFVIGTNASGKSNILDALEFLKKIANRVSVNEAVRSIRGGQDWVMRKGADRFEISVKVQNGGSYRYTIAVEKKENLFEPIEELLVELKEDGVEREIMSAKLDKLPGEDRIGYIASLGSGIKISYSNEGDTDNPALISTVPQLLHKPQDREIVGIVLRNLRGIFILNPNPAAMRNYVSVSDSLSPDAGNLAGLIAGLDDEDKTRVEQALSSYIKPLPERDLVRVWTEKVGLSSSDAMLYCEENWNGSPMQMDARGMSDGTLRFIAIVVALLVGQENSLLLVEEIDNGLHPSRSEELIKVLRELGAQRSIDIVCTTHNPVLIDTLGNSMVPFISYVKRNQDGNSEILLLEEKDNLAKLMSGNSLGGLMTNDLL